MFHNFISLFCLHDYNKLFIKRVLGYITLYFVPQISALITRFYNDDLSDYLEHILTSSRCNR